MFLTKVYTGFFKEMFKSDQVQCVLLKIQKDDSENSHMSAGFHLDGKTIAIKLYRVNNLFDVGKKSEMVCVDVIPFPPEFMRYVDEVVQHSKAIPDDHGKEAA